MKFPPSFLDDIRARITVSSVIGRKVAWDRRKTNAAKGDYWACCPFHGEKSPSFHADDRKGRYYCFGCKQSGDIFTYLIEKEGVPFPEAVAQLASEAGLPMPVFSKAEMERDELRTSLYEIMDISAKFFEAELQTARGAKARGYLSDRGLSPAIQKEFSIGYAPDDRSALRMHLADLKITVEQMAEAGLVITGDDIPVAYDRFRDRVMFPIRDPRGRVIAFGGRALRADVAAKYLNSPDTPLFHKGEILYNFDKARGVAHTSGQLIAVEGYVDVIAMFRAGFTEAVAPLGTALTENQIAIMWKAVPEPILCFDGDSAGQKAAYRALDLALPLLKPGKSLKFAFLPEGQDPDDLLKSEGPEAVKTVVNAAEPMASVLWARALNENDRSTPERRAAFEKDLRIQLSHIADETVRKHYLSDLTERLATLFQYRKPQRHTNALKHKFHEPSWKSITSPSPKLKTLVSKLNQLGISQHRPKMIILGVINHPYLLHEIWSEFIAIDLPNKELEDLRSLILDAVSSQPVVENGQIRNLLLNKGMGPILSRLEHHAKNLNEWYLNPEAAANDARTGLRQMISLHNKAVTLDRELKAAEAAFAKDMTEHNQGVVWVVREQLSSIDGCEAFIDRFRQD